MQYEPKEDEMEDYEIAKHFEGKTLDDRYEISQVAGIGGMSYVFRGRHKRLGIDIAVKILKGEHSSKQSLLKRFEHEALTVAKIDHANIIKVYDQGKYVFEGRDWLYFVMEYLPGQTLDEFIYEYSPFVPSEAYTYMSQILRGLQEAHDHGIVHRDLKPSNIKIVEVREQIVLKILDFGISRLEAGNGLSRSQMTKAGDVFGTPHFMSPEQAQGRTDIDRRSDIYAAGILLFYMLTGKKPFEASNDASLTILWHQVNTPTPLPSGIIPEISKELDMVVLKAMAKDREERFEDADEFRRALRRAVFGTDYEVVPKSSVPPNVSISKSYLKVDTRPPPPIEYASTVISGEHSAVAKKKWMGFLPKWIKPSPKLLIISVAVLVVFLGLLLVLLNGSNNSKIESADKSEQTSVEGSSEQKLLEQEEPPELKENVIDEGEEVTLVTANNLSRSTQLIWKKVSPHQNKKSCLRVLPTVETIVKNNPGFADGHYWLYKCYGRSNSEKAKQHYQKYLKLKGR